MTPDPRGLVVGANDPESGHRVLGLALLFPA